MATLLVCHPNTLRIRSAAARLMIHSTPTGLPKLDYHATESLLSRDGPLIDYSSPFLGLHTLLYVYSYSAVLYQHLACNSDRNQGRWTKNVRQSEGIMKYMNTY